MKPRILVLTGKNTHHKYFINELSKVGEIVGVIIEEKEKRFNVKKIKRFGLLWTLSKLLSKFFSKIHKIHEPVSSLNKESIIKTFMQFEKKIITVKDINSKFSLEKIKRLKPDYICSLGGGLIKEQGISIAKKCALNFHSGISPFYNGADINSKVFESRNLNYIGGTLMIMKAKIDGGMILSHYLPSIEVYDTPNSLFFKGIIGGVELYKEFIQYNEINNEYKSINQNKAMHYYLGYDHNIMTDIIVRYFLKKGMVKKFIRESEKIDYYNGSKNLNDLFNSLKLF
jgi:folate-dependent phosphoribosylglycinamide formyltransferase PurN